MNFATFLYRVGQEHFRPTPATPKPMRSNTPLRASQDSAIRFSPAPFVLASDLFTSGLPNGVMPVDHSVMAVGTFTKMFDDAVRYYNIYLSNLPGGFLSIALNGVNIIESRVYRLYTEVPIPTLEDMEFWLVKPDEVIESIPLDADRGHIGKPVVWSREEDGGIEFYRSWYAGAGRIRPFTPTETVIAANGELSRLHHQMMNYTRQVSPNVMEHMLFSAIGENSFVPTGVTAWLGVDVELTDIMVYPAADAPEFHPV